MTGADQAFAGLALDYERTVEREVTHFLGISYAGLIQQIENLVPIRENDLVLDVATATALIPLSLAGRLAPGGQAVGLDITPAMLQQARENCLHAGSPHSVSLVCGTGLVLPFARNTFDVVTCVFGTHHMNVPGLLAEMRRVVKAGGNVLLAEAAAPPLWRARWAKPLLRCLSVAYAAAKPGARARAEVQALPNIHTAGEWGTLLASAGFIADRLVEFPPRRPWYPQGLLVTGVAAP